MKTIEHDQLANASGGTPKFPGYYPYPYARPYFAPSHAPARQFAPWGWSPYAGYGGWWGGAPAFAARPRWWW